MSKSNGWRISADWGATSALLTIKHTVKHIFSLNKMGRKIPLFINCGVLKNNNDISHGISVFSQGEDPTEFFCIVCLVPHLVNVISFHPSQRDHIKLLPIYHKLGLKLTWHLCIRCNPAYGKKDLVCWVKFRFIWV